VNTPVEEMEEAVGAADAASRVVVCSVLVVAANVEPDSAAVSWDCPSVMLASV